MGNLRDPEVRRIMISAVLVCVIVLMLAMSGCATSPGGNGAGGDPGETGDRTEDPEFCYDCFPYPVKKPDSPGEREG